jgi:hypothetical protein
MNRALAFVAVYTIQTRAIILARIRVAFVYVCLTVKASKSYITVTAVLQNAICAGSIIGARV